YTFCDRLQLGLQQLMAGARKFGIEHLERSDLVSLTREATDVTGIPYVMESDVKEAKNILFGKI
ncbi:MAG: FMN-binding glutamate synthase family protein, partial [Thermodesulfovibrionales bacterium]